MKEKVTEIQHDLRETAGKVWFAGLGALTVASEEGSKLFRNLVEKGKEFDDRESTSMDSIRKTMEDAKGRAGDMWTRIEDSFNDRVAGALKTLGVPTREEIKSLTERVDALMEAIEKQNQEEKSSKPKRAASKTAANKDATA